MKNTISFLLCLILAFAVPDAAADQDARGSKDHPLLSRMPDFYISEYEDMEFGGHKFIGVDKKPADVEGHKYYIEYKLNKGASEPGKLKIRRNVQDALKKIGGEVIFDDNFNRTSTLVISKQEKETWVEIRSYNNMYRLRIDHLRSEVIVARTSHAYHTAGKLPCLEAAKNITPAVRH